MKKDLFICGGRVFKTLNGAIRFANKVQNDQGIILGIEKV